VLVEAESILASTQGREASDRVFIACKNVEVTALRADGNVGIVTEGMDLVAKTFGVVFRGPMAGCRLASRHRVSFRTLALISILDRTR
jgi:hypothetical protein